MQKVFLAYFKSRMGAILLFLLFLSVFSGMCLLYELPWEPVGYAAALCAVGGTFVCVWDAGRFVQRHRRLAELEHSVSLLDQPLPRAEHLLEEDYQKLILRLRRDQADAISALDRRNSEQLDYYTLWAHQIKTPLSAMNLLLQTQALAQEAGRAELEQELFKVEQYVEMALQYLRLDSDTTDYVLRTCDLDTILKRAVRQYSSVFIRKKLRLNYQSVNAAVLTDEKWLGFVIGQVLSNALKYTQTGGVTITLEPGCVLVIADTGMGIHPEDLPRVWERGYTGFNGRAEQKSTGIGLYLCRRILTQLGHTIQIASCPGKGTRVSIGLASEKRVVE